MCTTGPGFARKLPTAEQVFVLRGVFRTEISEGFDPAWLAQILVDARLLVPDTEGNTTRDERLPKLGKERVYRFSPNITGIAP